MCIFFECKPSHCQRRIACNIFFVFSYKLMILIQCDILVIVIDLVSIFNLQSVDSLRPTVCRNRFCVIQLEFQLFFSNCQCVIYICCQEHFIVQTINQVEYVSCIGNLFAAQVQITSCSIFYVIEIDCIATVQEVISCTMLAQTFQIIYISIFCMIDKVIFTGNNITFSIFHIVKLTCKCYICKFAVSNAYARSFIVLRSSSVITSQLFNHPLSCRHMIEVLFVFFYIIIHMSGKIGNDI